MYVAKHCVIVSCAALLLSLPATSLAEDCEHGFETREARYANGTTPLAGVWFAPARQTSGPAVVVLQGSGDSGRSNQWSYMLAEELAACGMGVLLTDKRGSDESGGDWHLSDFLDLALDGEAAMEWASAQPNVDSDRLGFLGLSQGGHVAPLAGRVTQQADFVINAVGSALSMKDTLLHELEQTYRSYHLGEEQIAFLARLALASFVFIETGEGWEEYLAIRSEVARSPLALAAESWPTEPEDWYWTFWRNIHDFDPVPHWQAFTVREGKPVLVVYGELDEQDNVPVARSVEALKTAVPDGPLTVRVFPGLGHSLMTPEREWDREVLDLLVSWINTAALGALPIPAAASASGESSAPE